MALLFTMSFSFLLHMCLFVESFFACLFLLLLKVAHPSPYFPPRHVSMHILFACTTCVTTLLLVLPVHKMLALTFQTYGPHSPLVYPLVRHGQGSKCVHVAPPFAVRR